MRRGLTHYEQRIENLLAQQVVFQPLNALLISKSQRDSLANLQRTRVKIDQKIISSKVNFYTNSIANLHQFVKVLRWFI